MCAVRIFRYPCRSQDRPAARVLRPTDCANYWCTLTVAACYLYRGDLRLLTGRTNWGNGRGFAMAFSNDASARQCMTARGFACRHTRKPYKMSGSTKSRTACTIAASTSACVRP